MGLSLDVLEIQEVEALAPALDPDGARMLYAALNAQIRRLAPCLGDGSSSDDGLAEARWIASQAVRRLLDVKGWVKSETTGRYSVVFTDVPSDIFSSAEASTLAGLCQGAAVPGLPAGSFPVAAGVERLFRSSLSRDRWW